MTKRPQTATKAKEGHASPLPRKPKKNPEKSTDPAEPIEQFTPKRGRPTQAQVAAIERSILSVARRMFLESGYANTSMEAVAFAASVSKGTLYTRYPAKSDLFRAIVSHTLAEWAVSQPQPPINSQLDIAEFLIQIGNMFLAALVRPEVAAFHRLILTEADRFPELAEEFRLQGYTTAIEQLASEIERGGKAAGWPTTDAREVAIAFTSALLGWYREQAPETRMDMAARSRFVARLVSIFIGGRSAW